MIENIPEIKITGVDEKETDDKGQWTTCRAIYIEPKDDDRNKKPDYYDWEEAEDLF